MTDTTTEPRISNESCLLILESISRREKLRRMTNLELSCALVNIWQDLPLCDVNSDILDEAIDRLRCLDVPVDELQRKIEDEILNAEPSDEDLAAIDRIHDRVMAIINGKANVPTS